MRVSMYACIYVKEEGCETCIFAVTNVTRPNNFLKRKSVVFINCNVKFIRCI